MKLAVLSLSGCFLSVTYSNANCVNFVSPPMAFDRTSWSDLEKFKAAKSLNPNIDRVQTIAGTGQGKLNIDQYSIVIDKAGQSATAALKDVRANLSTIIFSGSSYTNVKAYDSASETLWKSDAYDGAVLVFTLDSIAGVIDTETGAVVVSCHSPTNFIFSTVKVGSANTYTSPGWHPVSGNRAFGVRDNGDDSLTIFVKAADRIVDAGMFGNPAMSNEYIFGQGHKVWVQMLKNIKAKYANRHPRNEGVFSTRIDY
jgi:hypothetical protein